MNLGRLFAQTEEEGCHRVLFCYTMGSLYGIPHYTHHWTTEFEILSHPACSPALDPSDLHPFGSFRNALRSCRFVDGDEVKEAVHESFVIKLKSFFTVASRSLKIFGLHGSRRKV